MMDLPKILLILAICTLSTGCDEFGWNPLDPERGKWRSANRADLATILLEIDVPTLSDTASFFESRIDPSSGLIQRRRTWRGPPGANVAASLMEMRSVEGVPLGEPPTPKEAAAYWDILAQREKTYQVLYKSANAIGPVLWQRFTMGPQICLLFTQGVAPDGGEPTRHLLGYYCAAAGAALTDGQAETVVRSVRVQEGDPGLSPDG